MYRATFSLPAGTAVALNRVAKRLGVSQSALLGELLSEPIAALDAMLDSVPLQPTRDDVLRARGRSAELVRSAVANALAVVDAIESPTDNR